MRRQDSIAIGLQFDAEEVGMKKPLWKYFVNIFIAVSCAVYLLILYYFAIGKSSAVAVNGSVHSANLIPFKTIAEYIFFIVHGVLHR